jgi:hypothetical protein
VVNIACSMVLPAVVVVCEQTARCCRGENVSAHQSGAILLSLRALPGVVLFVTGSRLQIYQVWSHNA